MRIRIIFAVFICKITRFLLRGLKRGGTALPGKIAVKVCPDVLKHLARDVECIAITGTNGKTTSARMLEQFFIDAGESFFSNKSGSNLMQGITAEFIQNSTAAGNLKRKYAIIECDEAASKKVFEYLDPKILLITNVFSDQLGLIGGVKETLENIKIGVQNSPNAVVCLNADDPLISSIAEDVPNRIVFFGVEKGVFKDAADELSDATQCVRCAAAGYEYDYTTYGHLGGFCCPSCGYTRKSPDVAVTELISRDVDSQTVRIRTGGGLIDVTINIPGGYNIYNAAGAIAAAIEMGFSLDAAKDAMLRFECGFGRMEKFVLDSLHVRMILVKNPAGCNQVLNYLRAVPGDALFVVCLNDHIADGTDVSWIWDARFEKLLDMGDRLHGVLVSGTRADDMAQRLKAAGLSDERVRVFNDYGELLDAMLGQDAPVYVMPSYTAMLELRGVICRRFGIKEYWE